MNPLLPIAALVACIAVGYGAGWNLRAAIATRESAALTAAHLTEAERQAGVTSNTETYLRDQLTRAEKANASARLGSVRCRVGVRDEASDVQTSGAPAGGTDGTAAGDDAVTGAPRDIGPELEAWAISLTKERERLRALQYFDANRAAVK